MKSLYNYILENKEEIIQEAFIDNVFVKFKKTQNIMNKLNKAKTKLTDIAKSTQGTYKSVGKDGIKAWIGDIAYLISNDDKCKQLWNRGVFKALSQMNDKSKSEIIQNLYNDDGSGYKDIYDFINLLTDKLSTQYKWSKMDQTVYVNDNEEPDDETNYDLFIDTLQIIAIEIKNTKTTT